MKFTNVFIIGIILLSVFTITTSRKKYKNKNKGKNPDGTNPNPNAKNYIVVESNKPLKSPIDNFLTNEELQTANCKDRAVTLTQQVVSNALTVCGADSKDVDKCKVEVQPNNFELMMAIVDEAATSLDYNGVKFAKYRERIPESCSTLIDAVFIDKKFLQECKSTLQKQSQMYKHEIKKLKRKFRGSGGC